MGDTFTTSTQTATANQRANKMITLNIGTDRNGIEPTNAFKTEQQVFAALGKHITRVKWATSEPIGDWPAERIMIVQVDCKLLAVDTLNKLSDDTCQHAIAAYCHDWESGVLVWGNNCPDSVEREPFDVSYFHFA